MDSWYEFPLTTCCSRRLVATGGVKKHASNEEVAISNVSTVDWVNTKILCRIAVLEGGMH